MIHILDHGMGNPASVRNMLARAGAVSILCGDADVVAQARKIILPGVGAFDAGMDALRARGLDEAVKTAASHGAFVLGICLGMQLLFDCSEEGQAAGLGMVPGTVRRFRGESLRLPVPHMGWNEVVPSPHSLLLDSAAPRARFYFVHSYFVECADPSDVAGTATYGHPFVCAVQRGRVLGVQFHPEKSHRFGMAVLRRFAELTC